MMNIGCLQIQNGPFAGLQYKLLHSITIGRDKCNGVQLLDQRVSRTHARIDRDNGCFRVRDLNSKNGTYINGEIQKTRLLESGDRIRLGTTDMLFSEKELLGRVEETTYWNLSVQKEAESFTRAEISEGFSSEVTIPELARRYQAILRVNQAIGSEKNLKVAFKKVLEEIFEIIPAERGTILAINGEIGKLETVCSISREHPAGLEDIVISKTILNRVLQESVGLLVHDAMQDDWFSLSESICAEKVRSALCVPLLKDGETVGIIYLDTADQVQAFDDADLDLLLAVAGPASVHLQNTHHISQLRESYWDTIVALANAVDARDPYTIGHNWRVSRLATTVASYLDWTDNAIGRIELGGILHDIGKIGVRDAILLKNGPLDQLEMKTMQRHPELGTRMINGIDCLLPVIPHILYHHEHWDGNGYPYGLRGAEIPKEGRLLAVCDAFDAMSTTRPYRVALKPQEAINELVRNSGKQFDPNFVSAFITTWESGKITRNLERIGKGYLSQKSSHAYTELQNFSSVL